MVLSTCPLLQPENILLDESMNVKVADFGLSRTYDPNSKLETFCGRWVGVGVGGGGGDG